MRQPKAPSGPKGRKAPTVTVSRSATKALDALEFLRTSDQAVPLGRIAEILRLPKPSAYRLLFTLQSKGYLVVDAAGRYQMPVAVRPALPNKLLPQLINAAAAHMKELVRDCRETVSLAALFENHIEVVAVVESPEIIRMGNIVGRILQPNASSLGKAIAAFQPEERRDRLIRSYGLYRFTDATITEENALLRELRRVREAGYATDREETVPGGVCFGVPIFAAGPCAIGAISASTPKMRLSPEHEQHLVQALLETAKSVSSALKTTLSRTLPDTE